MANMGYVHEYLGFPFLLAATSLNAETVRQSRRV